MRKWWLHRPGTSERECPATVLPLNVTRDRNPNGIRIAQVKTVKFRIRVFEAFSRRGLRGGPELRLRVPERREAWNVGEQPRLRGRRAIQRTSILVDLGIRRNSEGSMFGWALCNPHLRMDCSPEGEKTVNIRVMQVENRIKS